MEIVGGGWEMGFPREAQPNSFPPRVGWDCRSISWQPPAYRDHPHWSSEAVSRFLVSTMPGLPWSSIARHLSCCYLSWLLCLPRSEPQEHLMLSQVTLVNCSFFLSPWLSLWPLSPLHGFAVAPGFLFPQQDGARGQDLGQGGQCEKAFPLLLLFQCIVQAAHLFFWHIPPCSLQRLIFSGWFQKQWEMPMWSQRCKSTLKPSLDLEPGLARSAIKFSKGKRKKAISHHRSSGVFSMGTMMFWLSSKNFSNY